MYQKIRVGERFAIYLPKRVARRLNISEGDELILRVVGDVIEIRKVYVPIKLALEGEKFAKVSLEEVEEVSLAEQRRKIEGSS